MNYILVIIATILLALDFSLNKKYQSFEGTDMHAGLKFNMLNGLFTAFIFFAISGFKLHFSLFSAALALCMALLCMTYNIIGFSILKKAGTAIYTIFLMSGGMLLPYLYGVIFLNEPLNVFRIAGILIMLIAIIFSNKTKNKISASLLVLCLAVFILNGGVSIVSKYHQISTYEGAVSASEFVMYSGIGRALLGLIGLLFCKGKGNPAKFTKSTSLIIVAGSAVIGGVSYLFQLIGAKSIPASALYPIITGGSIIFSAIAGKLFFKEKLSKATIISIILCFIGTLLFL